MTHFELISAEGKKYIVSKSWTRLGRGPENDLAFDDHAISKHHLNFFIKNSQLIVEDVGSQNGFRVNGQIVQSAVQLKVGDLIEVGHQRLKVGAPGAAQNENLHSFQSQNARARPNLHTQTAAYRKYNSHGSPQLRLILFFVLGLGGAYYYVENEKKVDAPAARKPSAVELTEALPNEAFRNKRPGKKSPQMILSESKFNQALRDYNNQLYNRALLGFQEALTLDNSNSRAAQYIDFTKEKIKWKIERHIANAYKNYQHMKYRRAKQEMVSALGYISEDVPNFNRKIAQQALTDRGLGELGPTQSLEESLLDFPCDKTQYMKECKAALKMIKLCREQLGEEDVYKP